MIAEPALEIDDIQAHLLPGFGTRYQRHVYLRLVDVVAARQPLIDITNTMITTARDGFALRRARGEALATTGARPESQAVLVALAVSPAGARRFTPSDFMLADGFVANGMAADARDLGDPVADDRPQDWRFGGTEETTPDLVLLLGSEDRGALEERYEAIAARLAGAVSEIWVDKAEMQLMDPANPAAEFEHFGFRDGISQPVPRGTDETGSPLYRRRLPRGHPLAATHADFGKPLIWPGQFVFGYPKQAGTDAEAPAVLDADAGPGFMLNGSYLVVRRLRQDVAGFWAHMDAELARFAAANPTTLTREGLAARLVGRWTNGAPLMRAPDAPREVPARALNHFGYRTGTAAVTHGEAGVQVGFDAVPTDPFSLLCPTAAHIRKVNPRDRHESGSATQTLLHLFLRRGITFGPAYVDDPEAERGLVFACYQTSVEDQFRFVQTQWANSSTRPGVGQDRIIGKGPPGNPVTSTRLRLRDGNVLDFAANPAFVEMTGGGYFLLPGVSGLIDLLAGVGA